MAAVPGAAAAPGAGAVPGAAAAAGVVAGSGSAVPAPNAAPTSRPPTAGAASEPGADLPVSPSPRDPKEEERQAADKRLEEAQARQQVPLDPKARAAVLNETALPSVGGRPVRGYAQKGILELGGSFSLVNATDFLSIGVAPTAGWFFIDNVSLSLIPQVSYVKAGDEPVKIRTVVLLEPGFHMQMAGPIFAFFGAGVGVAYEKQVGTGMALSPRAGLKVLAGGSGVLTAAFEYVYSANQKSEKPTADDPNSATYGVRAGYSVAW